MTDQSMTPREAIKRVTAFVDLYERIGTSDGDTIRGVRLGADTATLTIGDLRALLAVTSPAPEGGDLAALAPSLARKLARVAELVASEPQSDPLEHLSRATARIGEVRYALQKVGALTDEVDAKLEQAADRIRVGQDAIAAQPAPSVATPPARLEAWNEGYDYAWEQIAARDASAAPPAEGD